MTDYQTAIEGMGALLNDLDRLTGSFSRSAYPSAFQEYYLQCVPFFDAIEHLYLNVTDKDTMLGNMASALSQSAYETIEKTHRRKKPTVMINQSLAMACFVYPAVLRYNGQSTSPLVEHIQVSWKEKFPKSNITPASYEIIEKGFHRKWCYITTASCRARGMADDCYELDLLRNYRDTYMISVQEGSKLIHDYYDIAPSIVKHIDKCPDSEAIYSRIWDSYIDPCIRMIEEGHMDECLDVYKRMVLDLKEKYFYLPPAAKPSSGKIR